MRLLYRLTRVGEHEHSYNGSPKYPHGHGFMGTYEHEVRRVWHRSPGARYSDNLVLNGLSQGFKVGVAEFWKLVQEHGLRDG